MRYGGKAPVRGLKANGHPVSITTEATEWESQRGLPVVVSAIQGSNGSKPEDSPLSDCWQLGNLDRQERCYL